MTESVVIAIVNSSAVLLASFFTYVLMKRLDKYGVEWTTKTLAYPDGESYVALAVRINNSTHHRIKVKLIIEGLTRRPITDYDSILRPFIILNHIGSEYEIKEKSYIEIIVGKIISDKEYELESLPVVRNTLEASVRQIPWRFAKIRKRHGQTSKASISTTELLSKVRLESDLKIFAADERLIWNKLFKDEIYRRCEDIEQDFSHIILQDEVIDAVMKMDRHSRRYTMWLIFKLPTYYVAEYFISAIRNSDSKDFIRHLQGQLYWNIEKIHEHTMMIIDSDILELPGYENNVYKAVKDFCPIPDDRYGIYRLPRWSLRNTLNELSTNLKFYFQGKIEDIDPYRKLKQKSFDTRQYNFSTNSSMFAETIYPAYNSKFDANLD